MKITLKTTATQVAKELDKLSIAGESAQWAKRTLIADVSEVHGWSSDDLGKGGSGAAFLLQVNEKSSSKAQMSELRSYAHPLVRSKVPAIRQHAEALSEREDFKGQRAGNVANLLVTQIKGGKSVPDAVDQVTQDRIQKNADRDLLKNDDTLWLKKQRDDLVKRMGSRCTKESVGAFGVKLDEAIELLVFKSSDTSEPAADIASVLDSLGLDEDKATLLAALLSK